VLALSGFHYSAVTQTMEFAAKTGRFFWSTGYAWGLARLLSTATGWQVELRVHGGTLPPLEQVILTGQGPVPFILR
jgi:hypothetical protein